MPSLSKYHIQITIIDDSSSEKCDARCGVDWSSRGAIARASRQIKTRFGSKAQLKYLDLSKATANQALEWNQVIQNKNLSLPLLVINGQPRISGQFDIRQLLDAIEADMEMGE